MKLSIAIADSNALESAFVVFRGFEESIPKAAKLGYNGVELALKRVDEINLNKLDSLLQQHDLIVSCISTGQVYADGGLVLTHSSKHKRLEVKTIFKDFIDMADGYGKMVNIGRARGTIGDRNKDYVESLFIDVVRELCEYASPKGVSLVLEPLNRYESDFINTVEEGVRFVKEISSGNLGILPDVFHMNIEEKNIGAEFCKNIDYIKYIHFADSNRMAPGQGHLDFSGIFASLQNTGYTGWISTEILPRPDADKAASQAIEFLLPFLNKLANGTLNAGLKTKARL